jgi:class 3 adenylate cyclase
MKRVCLLPLKERWRSAAKGQVPIETGHDSTAYTVTEKNEILETLSSKLSKYLSPQIYQSIFRGDQNVEISSKRKKLTICFTDIAGFTETTDNLESEELTNVLNHYLTEMSADCAPTRSDHR